MEYSIIIIQLLYVFHFIIRYLQSDLSGLIYIYIFIL